MLSCYGLFGLSNICRISPYLVSETELLRVHSPEFIKKLRETNSDSFGTDFDKFGLSYDCPPQDNLFNRVRLIFGSTMAAAHAISSGKVKTAINWLGGWHHGTKDKASGFCYVNDINGAIDYLTNSTYAKNKKSFLYRS